MKYFASLLIVFQFLAVAALGQKPTPTDDDVVHISTDLIQVDVTVTDKDGKVVSGLTADDFELYENGEKQKISNFSFIDRKASGASASTSGQPGVVKDGEQHPGAVLRSPRTIAIVVDDLNLSFPSVYFTRKALKRFVDEQMQPDDLVAIVRTGGGVGALQQFTSDKRLLYAAIERLRWNPRGSGGFDPLSSVGQRPEDVTERFNTESDLVAAIGGEPREKERK
ncbi:MAG: VWA domain-containing protein, partial [Acidobacteriota bacterium]